MKVTANIATYPKRHDQLKKMLPSILEQFDEIRICLNQYDQAPQFLKHEKIKVVIPPIDLKDNGKFMFIEIADKDELYCTLDDDFIYPSDYRRRLELEHKNYPDHVLTFHGRKLKGKYKNYYKAPHQTFRCLGNVNENAEIDVCGTGVSAFIPFEGSGEIARSALLKMSDVLFSLHCAFKNKPIICLSHKMGWIKPIDSDVSIYKDESTFDFRQAALCKKIYELKNE